MRRTIALLSIILLSACANNPPPALSPQAKAAWYGTTVIHDLDLLRNVAQDGEAMTPKLVSTVDARKITQWHESAIKVVHDSPNGWQATVQASLSELTKNLPPSESQLLGPYIRLLQTILAEVTK